MKSKKKNKDKGKDGNNTKKSATQIETKLRVDEAGGHLKSKLYNKALLLYNKALEMSPNDKNALLARSKCYLLLGEPQKALEDAEAALNEKIKDPGNARAMYYKAEALYHLGDFELSLVYYYRGMRIRPEFDQFRLGVQKAKEAIQNILGDNSVPIKIDPAARVEEINKTEAAKIPANLEIPEDPAPTAAKEPERSMSADKTMSESSGDRRRLSSQSKRKNNCPNLLGQLNVDKKYLQDLLKCPDVKAAHQESAQHITKYAEEGISFLKNRQEFWRQQRSVPLK